MRQLLKGMSGVVEKDVEKAVSQHAELLGFLSYKFQSPSKRGVPDRLFLAPGAAFFIEFKTPQGRLSEQQIEQIKAIKSLGHDVYVVDDVFEGKKIVESYRGDQDHQDNRFTLSQVEQVSTFFLSELSEEDGEFIESMEHKQEFTSAERSKVEELVERYGFNLSGDPWA